jgi:hypothetical protein
MVATKAKKRRIRIRVYIILSQYECVYSHTITQVGGHAGSGLLRLWNTLSVGKGAGRSGDASGGATAKEYRRHPDEVVRWVDPLEDGPEEGGGTGTPQAVEGDFGAQSNIDELIPVLVSRRKIEEGAIGASK